jgi:hypothetical protein
MPDSEELRPWVEKWRKHELTSFKFISLLNFVSGRAFVNPAVYPVFPSPAGDFQNCNDVTLPSLDGTFIKNKELANSTNFEGKLFALPELYFLPESASARQVHDNRKKLEGFQNLEVWICKVFGTAKFSHRRLFAERVAPRLPFKPLEPDFSEAKVQLESEIIFAGSFKSDHETAEFGCILRTGRHVIIRVGFAEKTVAASGNRKLGANMAEWRFWTIADRRAIIAYSKSTLSCVTDNWIFSKSVVLPCPAFSEAVALVSPTRLSRFAFSANAASFTAQFCNLRERVVCFASSRRFGVTAVACGDGKLRIRSNKNGLKMATASLAGEIADVVIITKSWGYIVVKTIRTVFVFTVNGGFVAKSKNSARLGKWTTFRNFDGFDLVAFEDGKGKLWCFEPIDPGKVEQISIGITNVAAITFDWRRNRFVVLGADGSVALFAGPGGDL